MMDTSSPSIDLMTTPITSNINMASTVMSPPRPPSRHTSQDDLVELSTHRTEHSLPYFPQLASSPMPLPFPLSLPIETKSDTPNSNISNMNDTAVYVSPERSHRRYPQLKLRKRTRAYNEIQQQREGLSLLSAMPSKSMIQPHSSKHGSFDNTADRDTNAISMITLSDSFTMFSTDNGGTMNDNNDYTLSIDAVAAKKLSYDIEEGSLQIKKEKEDGGIIKKRRRRASLLDDCTSLNMMSMLEKNSGERSSVGTGAVARSSFPRAA